MVKPTDLNNPANDPVVQRIALAFLAGFHGEHKQKQKLLDFLNSDDGKRVTPALTPELAKYYERMTQQDEQQSRLESAIAVGVGFAVLTALKERGLAR